MVLTTSAFINLLFRLLAVDRQDVTATHFQSDVATDLNSIFNWFFGDARNFRNVRRQIHENLALTTLGSQVPIELYLQPVICIGTGTHATHIRSQPRGTLIADCDFSIDCDPDVLPHHCCDAWHITSLPFNVFGCVFFAHVGRHPPFDNGIDLTNALTVYYCSLLSGGVFIFNSLAFEHADAPEKLAQKQGYNTFDEWKHVWIAALSNIGFIDIEIMIKEEVAFKPKFPNAVSILLVARKEL